MKDYAMTLDYRMPANCLPRVLPVAENYPLKLGAPLAHQRDTEFSSVITILERNKFPERYEKIDQSPAVPSISSEP